MSSTVSPDLAARWATYSVVEQLGNVGSEVSRAIRARATGNTVRFEAALVRALDLFDLTATDPRWRGARRREILRAREEFCRLFFDGNADPAVVAATERYFLHLARAANAERRENGGA
jgi:hypothetical protein